MEGLKKQTETLDFKKIKQIRKNQKNTKKTNKKKEKNEQKRKKEKKQQKIGWRTLLRGFLLFFRDWQPFITGGILTACEH